MFRLLDFGINREKVFPKLNSVYTTERLQRMFIRCCYKQSKRFSIEMIELSFKVISEQEFRDMYYSFHCIYYTSIIRTSIGESEQMTIFGSNGRSTFTKDIRNYILKRP